MEVYAQNLLYDIFHSNTVINITHFRYVVSKKKKKCKIIYRNDHLLSFFCIICTFLFGCNTIVQLTTVPFMAIFLYNLCIFVGMQYSCFYDHSLPSADSGKGSCQFLAKECAQYWLTA